MTIRKALRSLVAVSIAAAVATPAVLLAQEVWVVQYRCPASNPGCGPGEWGRFSSRFACEAALTLPAGVKEAPGSGVATCVQKGGATTLAGGGDLASTVAKGIASLPLDKQIAVVGGGLFLSWLLKGPSPEALRKRAEEEAAAAETARAAAAERARLAEEARLAEQRRFGALRGRQKGQIFSGDRLPQKAPMFDFPPPVYVGPTLDGPVYQTSHLSPLEQLKCFNEISQRAAVAETDALAKYLATEASFYVNGEPSREKCSLVAQPIRSTGKTVPTGGDNLDPRKPPDLPPGPRLPPPEIPQPPAPSEPRRPRPEPPSPRVAPEDEATAFKKRVDDFCSDTTPTEDATVQYLRNLKDCRTQYAMLHKNDEPGKYPPRRNVEHYFFMRDACEGKMDLGFPKWAGPLVAPVAGVVAIGPYSLWKLTLNTAGKVALLMKFNPAWAHRYQNSPPSLEELEWAFRGLLDCFAKNK